MKPLFKKKKVEVDDIVFAIYKEKNGVGVLFDQSSNYILTTSFAALAYKNPTFGFVLRAAVKTLDEKGSIMQDIFGGEEGISGNNGEIPSNSEDK